MVLHWNSPKYISIDINNHLIGNYHNIVWQLRFLKKYLECMFVCFVVKYKNSNCYRKSPAIVWLHFCVVYELERLDVELKLEFLHSDCGVPCFFSQLSQMGPLASFKDEEKLGQIFQFKV